MKPSDFKGSNAIYAADQPQYLPLPVHKAHDGTVTSMWKLTLFERLKVLFIGRFWFHQMTFHSPLQPQLPSVNAPKIDGLFLEIQ